MNLKKLNKLVEKYGNIKIKDLTKKQLEEL